jgi:DNA-binding CsgD family transcriptional regulator
MALLRAFSRQLNNTPISTFCYLRFYKDGKLLYLSNNDSWLKAYIYDEYYNYSEHTKCYTANGKGGYYTWLGNEIDPVFSKAKELNIFNGINFCRRKKDFCESFVFSSSNSHIDLVNYYMNHTNKIKNMSDIFCNQYLEKLTIDKEYLFNVDFHVKRQIHEICDSYAKESTSKIKFDETTFIGKKALACVYWTCHGKSADEIAHILHISRRTVEDHFSSLKIKLNCANKYALIYKILSLRPDIISDYPQ